MELTKRIFVGMVLSLAVLGPVMAASNGCDKEGADYINPALALCSTHVYNVGRAQNLENPADRQEMQEVIATKTTVITQQIYKQYEYLDATIRRLKTQLEKAILTTSLQAAGATDDSGGATSSSRSTDKNVILLGAENCVAKGATDAVLSCIQNNIQIVLNAVAAGNIGDAKRQMDKNLEFAALAQIISGEAKKYKLKNGSLFTECNNMTANKRDLINNCAYALNIQVMNTIDERSRAQKNK